MSNHFDPGPPLKPEDEFCACQPPTSVEYAKAAGAAFLVAMAGAGTWFGVVMLTHKLWGITTILIGLAAGWAINRGAGSHRSLALGIMGAGTTVFAALLGYGLLWLPFVSDAVDRQLSWYDAAMMALGAFAAYRLAGPKPKAKDSLK